MDKAIATIILAWHAVYVSLTESVEHARIVLDQSDRGTLLPDRVREMRGHLINVRESIPELADLLEELTGKTAWPMKVEGIEDEVSPTADEEAAAEAAHEARVRGDEPPATAEGDYDVNGSTPVPPEEVDEEAAAEVDEEGEVGTSTVLPGN